MANKLATTTANPPAGIPTGLPQWLRYLIGAFPGARVLPETFMVYEHQFAEVDPAMMMQAVQHAVRGHPYATFPTIAEVWQAVEAVQSQIIATTPAPAVNLSAQRAALLERAYAGHPLDPAEWDRLINQLRLARRGEAANALAHKFTQFTGGIT